MANDSKVTKTPRIVTVEASYTRPANTTAYADGDCISASASAGDYLTLTDAASVNGYGGTIIGATLTKSAAGTTNADFDVVVFDTEPTAGTFNDNAACAPTDAEAADVCATIKLTATDHASDLSVNTVYQKPHNAPFVCESDSTALYATLVARGAYTPASGEVFTLRLMILQD